MYADHYEVIKIFKLSTTMVINAFIKQERTTVPVPCGDTTFKIASLHRLETALNIFDQSDFR